MKGFGDFFSEDKSFEISGIIKQSGKKVVNMLSNENPLFSKDKNYHSSKARLLKLDLVLNKKLKSS